MFFSHATLTSDLRSHPRDGEGISLHQILGLYIKWFNHDNADRHTDTQEEPILYPRPLTLEGMLCLRKRALGLGPGSQHTALGPGRPVAGTSCLVQPGPKPRALFLNHIMVSRVYT